MKRRPLLRRRLILCATVLTLMSGSIAFPTALNAQLTKNYATDEISHSTGAAFSGTFNVPDFANASDGVESTFATLDAQTILLVLSNNSFVEFGFSANVPAGSMLYIPVQDDPSQGLLSTLAGGSLGNLLTGLLGDQSFQVEIKSSTGTSIVTYNSAGNGTRVFPQGTFNFVKDGSGQTFITFMANPGVNYSRIRVTANTSGLVAADYELKVQDAYYLSGTATPCDPLLTTSFDAQGLSLSLLNSNGAPVKNAERTIDADTANFSTFGYGIVNVGALGNISQDVYFSNLSKVGHQVKMKFRFPPSLLALGVLNNINVTAYRNDTLVATTDIDSVLSLQALGLLQTGINNNLPVYVQIPVGDTAQFNRVRITYNQLLSVGVDQMMELYGIDRVPPQPLVNVPTGVSCPGTIVHLSVANVTAGVSYKWYDSANVVVSTDTFYNATVPANGITNNYYVTSSDCPDVESVPTVVPVIGTNANCVAVSPVSFLQGAFNPVTNMNKDVTPDWAAILAANATSQPYNTPSFGYAGTETVAPSIFTSTVANDDVLDWMLLELKDSSGTLIDRKAVLVLENGNVTNTDKTQPVVLKAIAGQYHLTIRHRNHLGLSSNLNAFVSGQNIIDYTIATDTDLYGDANAYNTVNGKTLMIAGNASGNNYVSYAGSGNDRAVILAVIGGINTNVVNNVYSSADLNLSGTVYYSGTGNDRAIILNSLGGDVSVVRAQQIR
ncbi:MAG: hypothetical protein WC756_01280 [Taibaiella sp.]